MWNSINPIENLSNYENYFARYDYFCDASDAIKQNKKPTLINIFKKRAYRKTFKKHLHAIF